MKKIICLIMAAIFLSFTFASCDAINSLQTTSEQSTTTQESSQTADVQTPEEETSDEQAQEEQDEQAQSEPQDVVYPSYTTTLADIIEKGSLVIGIDENFSPMTYKDEQGNYIGFDIDLATAVCATLGVTPEFKAINWEQKENALNSGEIDCIWSGLSITNNRQQDLGLTGAYLRNILMIVTTLETSVNSETDLIGLRVGVQKGSSALEFIQSMSIYSSLQEDLIYYDNYDLAFADLQENKLDCIIVDEVYYVNKIKNSEIVFGTSPMDFGDDYYAVGTRKADIELNKQIDEALSQLKASGAVSEISLKWFGSDFNLV